MAAQPESLHTFEQYLTLERASEGRMEFHDGLIVAMSGSSEPHARLCARFTSLLDRLFPACRVYGDNLKLRIESVNRGFYPDAMVLCGEPVYWNDQNDVLLNPQIIVEVLSPSTAKFDRGAKRDFYETLESVSHILLVSQDSPFVECTRRLGDDEWTTERHVIDSMVSLESAALPVADIYHGIL